MAVTTRDANLPLKPESIPLEQSLYMERATAPHPTSEHGHTPTCILTGERGQQVKPFYLVSRSTSSAMLRCFEHRWGIPNGHIDLDSPDNMVHLRSDLHHAFDVEGFALLPSRDVLKHIVDQVRRHRRYAHSDGTADFPHYTTICPSAEYDYVFIPLRWSGIDPDLVNAENPEYALPENSCPPPGDSSVPFFQPLPPYNEPPFPKVRSRVHPFFILASKLWSHFTIYHDVLTALGNEYEEIFLLFLSICGMWRGPVSARPRPSEDYDFSCVGTQAHDSLNEPPESTCVPADFRSPNYSPVKRRRSSTSSRHDWSAKLAKVSSGDVASSFHPRIYCLAPGAQQFAQIQSWLDQLQATANLMEPEAAMDQTLRAYSLEPSIPLPIKLESWRCWRASWERKRDRGELVIPKHQSLSSVSPRTAVKVC